MYLTNACFYLNGPFGFYITTVIHKLVKYVCGVGFLPHIG